MDVAGSVVVVTGGGSGIGAALCRRFAAEGAHAVVVADVDSAAAQDVAQEIGGHAVAVDVSAEAGVRMLVERTIAERGRIDVYCSNAGVAHGGGAEAPDDAWRRSWDINVMAHVYAARALLPHMLERGGCIVGTISAAGLLNHVHAAPYAATKAAALSFFEWLAIAHGDAGVQVAVVCPQGVRTPMLLSAGPEARFLHEGALEPDAVAHAVLQGVREGRFLILPHPDVHEYIVRKAVDHDRWLRGMRRLRQMWL